MSVNFKVKPVIMKKSIQVIILTFCTSLLFAQPDPNKMGAWYMYFWTKSFKDSQWGLQGDIQYRNWNTIGDLEQLLLRGGLTYSPSSNDVKFTLGYANIQTGNYGLDNTDRVSESRIYQEALIPHKILNKVFLTHRFRYEQRWNENQYFRTRFRYNLFLNIPLNGQTIEKGTVYLALYNELFINGQREISDTRNVEIFDRNRFYTALGYQIKDNLKVQGGFMRQSTDSWSKNQLQLSLHHSF